ncbi:ecto-ADP-ribosyltransferase 4-like [Osmerus mordax]|uniref:ecto-ADP-ribosyltransferase 4-like n=1 Tax=Osmerus mordax TaxID=8014 RepID=UPI00350E8ECD
MVFLIFLHVCILTVDSMMISPLSEGSGVQKQVVKRKITLDMALKSVDDMYDGCTKEMHEKVGNILIEELTNEKFKNIWTASDTWAEKKLKDGGTDLTLNHFKALYAYTSVKNSNGKFYKFFTNDVRNSPEYPRDFQYRALHFLLSDAISILKQKQPVCVTTYRRTRDTFTGEKNDVFRFGSFTSSSLTTNEEKAKRYGKVGCFEIWTCFGAKLESNAVNELDEVLIPPYEMFKIDKVFPNGNANLKCNKVYKVKSAGITSYFNCKGVK